MLPLSYYFYHKALEKSFGSKVRLIYQDFNAPGDYPGAGELAGVIRLKGLPLPVVALGEEIIAAGRLPGVVELVEKVKLRLREK